MKYSKLRRTKQYNDSVRADGRALTKSSFEFLYGVILLVLAAVAVFSSFFRVVSYTKKSGNTTKSYSVVTVSYNYVPHSGDIVCVDVGTSFSDAKVIAGENEKILMGTGKSDAVNCVQYNGARYFSYEELEEAIGGLDVPKDYVLLSSNIDPSGDLRIGELIPKERVAGKVGFILYPFSMFGRTADYLK